MIGTLSLNPLDAAAALVGKRHLLPTAEGR